MLSRLFAFPGFPLCQVLRGKGVILACGNLGIGLFLMPALLEVGSGVVSDRRRLRPAACRARLRMNVYFPGCVTFPRQGPHLSEEGSLRLPPRPVLVLATWPPCGGAGLLTPVLATCWSIWEWSVGGRTPGPG